MQGPDRRVVEEAETHGLVGLGVVTRRAHAAEGVSRSARHHLARAGQSVSQSVGQSASGEQEGGKAKISCTSFPTTAVQPTTTTATTTATMTIATLRLPDPLVLLNTARSSTPSQEASAEKSRKRQAKLNQRAVRPRPFRQEPKRATRRTTTSLFRHNIRELGGWHSGTNSLHKAQNKKGLEQHQQLRIPGGAQH